MPRAKLSDKRNITWREYGDPEGQPVIFVHGFGVSPAIRHWNDDLARQAGLRFIAPCLPGVATSSRKKGRKIIDWAHDAEKLADRLGLERFCVVGHSAGGAHALAVASHMPQRVSRVVLLATAIEFAKPENKGHLLNADLRMLARLADRNLDLLVRGIIACFSVTSRIFPGFALKRLVNSLPHDRAVLLTPREQRERYLLSLREGLAHMGGGAFDIARAMYDDWGFDPSGVSVPVRFFISLKDDLVAPAGIAALAGSLPNSEITEWPDAGHFGFIAETGWQEVLNVLKE